MSKKLACLNLKYLKAKLNSSQNPYQNVISGFYQATIKKVMSERDSEKKKN